MKKSVITASKKFEALSKKIELIKTVCRKRYTSGIDCKKLVQKIVELSENRLQYSMDHYSAFKGG